MNQGRILNLIVRAYSGGVGSVLMGLSYALSSIAGQAKSASMILTAMGAVIAGVSAAFLYGLKKMGESAIDFDTHMRRILTLTDTAPGGFDKMKSAVLDLTRTIPKSANELADALYYVKSVITDDATAMDLLKLSAKAASLENANSAAVAKTLTSAYVAYHWKLSDAKVATDQLTQAVSSGRAEYSDFATQMGQLIGTGASLGISFKEMAIWMAFLTKRGYSAANSAVLVKNVMQKILNPTKAAIKLYGDLGIKWGANAVAAAGGLIPYLQQMGEKVSWNTDKLRVLFPGLRQLPLLLNMARDAARGTGSDLKFLSDQIDKSSGELDRRFADAMKGLGAQLTILKSAFREIGIRVGTTLLPVFTELVTRITPVVQAIAEWVKQNPELVKWIAIVTGAVATVGLVVGGFMVLLGVLLMFRTMLAAMSPFLFVLILAFTVMNVLGARFAIGLSQSSTAVGALKEALGYLKEAFAPLVDLLFPKYEDHSDRVAKKQSTLARFAEKVAFWIRDVSKAFKEWMWTGGAQKIVNGLQTIYGIITKTVDFFVTYRKQIAAIAIVAGSVFIGVKAFSEFGKAVSFGQKGLTALGWSFGKNKRPLEGFAKAIGIVYTTMRGGTSAGLGAMGKGFMLAVAGVGKFGGKLGMIPKILGYNISAGSKFLTIIGQFSKGGAKFAGGLMKMFGEVGKMGFGKALRRAFPNVSELLGGMFKGGGGKGLVQTVVGMFKGIPKALGGVFFEALMQMKIIFAGGLPGIWALIQGGLAGIWPAISAGLSAIGTAIAGAIAAAAPVVAIILIIVGVLYVLWKYWDQIYAVGQRVWTELWKVMQPIVQQIQSQFLPLWESLKELWVALEPVLMLVGAIIGGVLVVALGLVIGLFGALAGAIAGIIQIITGIVNIISGFVNVLVGLVKFLFGVFTGNAKMMEQGKALIMKGAQSILKGVGQVFMGLWNAVRGALSGFVKSVGAYFKGLFPEAWKWGQNMIEGLKQGLRSAWSKLSGLVQSLIDQLPGWVKSVLGIHSPSTVFRWLGQMVGIGFHQGIVPSLTNALTAAQGVMGRITDAVTMPSPSALAWQGTAGYTMRTVQTVRHTVEFGKLPEGVNLDLTAQDVADLLNGDEKASTQVARIVSRSQRREIR